MSESAGRLRLYGVIALVAAAAVVGVGVAARTRSEHQLARTAADAAVPTVAVIQPSTGKGEDTLALPANLQAFNNAPIYARTTGYVRRWLVNIGDPVRRGQVLAVLDAPEVEQQLAAARADLQTATANQQLARTTAARWSAMLSKDAVSKQEADERQGDLAAKTAVAAAARANVARLQTLTGFTRLTAPFDGVVTSRSAEIGALVVAGAANAPPLFTVADVSRIRAFVRVPQVYSSQVRPGMSVDLTVPEYPNRTFQGTLARSAGAVDPASGSVLVEVDAPNAERLLKPGAYAQASFALQSAGARLSLPPSALIIGEHGAQVAVLGPDNRAVLRQVVIGKDLGKAVEITSGVSPSDRVIDSPPDSLQTGDPVRVLKAAAKAPARAGA